MYEIFKVKLDTLEEVIDYAKFYNIEVDLKGLITDEEIQQFCFELEALITIELVAVSAAA